MSTKVLARKLFLAALVVWPMLHLALGLSGQFSAWRFAGWGMYATPYPSLAQHPISVLVQFAGPGCESAPPQPATVMMGADEVSGWLDERLGLRFYVRCPPPSAGLIQLGSRDVLALLAEEATAARQLRRAEHLEAMGALIQAQLTTSGAEPHELYVSIGALRAAPLAGKYGVEDQVFAYTDRLEPREVVFTAARAD
jgi:hypothetical protein